MSNDQAHDHIPTSSNASRRAPGHEPSAHQEESVLRPSPYQHPIMVQHPPLLALQRTVGNHAVNQLLARRMGQAEHSTAPLAEQRQRQEEQGDVAMAAERPHQTGLPDNLKAGVESLSGMSLDDVHVHYNSSAPVQLNALAYAQGSDIHVAPGQEHHLAHEAWHLVQQAQGRVQPTIQLQDGMPINDDGGLEQEADVMGASAEQLNGAIYTPRPAPIPRPQSTNTGSVQLVETLAQKIQRILKARKINMPDNIAEEYAKLLKAHAPNTPIHIPGTHRALKLNSNGAVSSVAYRPPSDSSNMRVSAQSGPMNAAESSMMTFGPRPLTGNILAQDATITAADCQNIPPRPNLGTVMGGSAAVLSHIDNSEWLHLIAHSMGGPDTPINLQAGPHSLNTAMIPFEQAVKQLVGAGHVVDYSVTFFSDLESNVLYVHHVEIRIQPAGPKAPKVWTLEVNRAKVGEFINGQILAEIKRVASEFVEEHL